MQWFPFVAVFSVAVYGTGIELYQEQIEQLSRNATGELQLIRKSHRLAVSSLMRKSLEKLGEYTERGRQRTAEALEYIDSFNGGLSEEQKICLGEAYNAQKEYAQVLDDDLSHCGSKVYNETSVDALEQFRDVAGSVQLAALLVLNQAMVAFEVEDSSESRERYLREELEFWSTLWELYSLVLENKLVEQRSDHKDALEFLEMCLEQAVFFFNNTIEYIKDRLEQCFAR